MIFRTDDPLADFAAWDREQADMMERLPECAYCGEKVQDDHYYLINDEVVCPDCLDSYFRKEVDDYFE